MMMPAKNSDLGSTLKRSTRFRGMAEAGLARPRAIPRGILARNRLWMENIDLEVPETTISAGTSGSENEICSSSKSLKLLNLCDVTHKIWWSNIDAEAFEFVFLAKGKSPKEKLDVPNPRGGTLRFWWINVDVFGVLKANIQKSTERLNPFGGIRKIYWSNIDLVLLHKKFNAGKNASQTTGKLQNLVQSRKGWWCNQDLGSLKEIACNENALQVVEDVVDSSTVVAVDDSNAGDDQIENKMDENKAGDDQIENEMDENNVGDDQIENQVDENNAEFWTAYWKYWVPREIYEI